MGSILPWSTIQNISGIVGDGYDNKKGVRQLYGPGHYSSPDPEVAEKYGIEFEDNGKKYKCILQNRVNMKKTKVVNEGKYFRTLQKDDIRPYGICIKEINWKTTSEVIWELKSFENEMARRHYNQKTTGLDFLWFPIAWSDS